MEILLMNDRVVIYAIAIIGNRLVG